MHSLTLIFSHRSKIKRPRLLEGKILLFYKLLFCLLFHKIWILSQKVNLHISSPSARPVPQSSRCMWGFNGAANHRGSRASWKPPTLADGSTASVSVCVSARSNSPIPYLEARGSRYCQESQVTLKWLPAKSFKIKTKLGKCCNAHPQARARISQWKSLQRQKWSLLTQL